MLILDANYSGMEVSKNAVVSKTHETCAYNVSPATIGFTGESSVGGTGTGLGRFGQS